MTITAARINGANIVTYPILTAEVGLVAAADSHNAYGHTLRFAAPTNGTTDARTAIANAATVAATSGEIIIDPGTYRVASNITLSCAVRFLPGAILKPDSGVTITIAGSFTAGAWKVFDLSAGGTIAFATSATFPDVLPDWYGVNGNVSPFDTAAVQWAFTVETLRPTRFVQSYYVTTVNFSASERTLDMNGFGLVGVASTPTAAALTIQGYRPSIRNLWVDTDYNTNYTDAVKIFADAGHPNAFQFGQIDGLTIDNALGGLLVGEVVGGSPYSAPISECTISCFRTRGVQRPVTINQPNGFLDFTGSHAVVSKNDWDSVALTAGSFVIGVRYRIVTVGTTSFTAIGASANTVGTEFVATGVGSGTGTASPFTYTDAYILRCNQGGVSWRGGSLESNDSGSEAGVGLWGKNITVDGGTTVEIRPSNTVEGGMSIGPVKDAAWGIGGSAAFIVSSGATGQLLLHNTAGSYATANSAVFVDGSLAPNFEVVCDHSDIEGWGWDYASGSGVEHPLIKGCLATYTKTRVKDLAGTFDILLTTNRQQNRLTACDPIGNTMSTTHDRTTKGGWAIGAVNVGGGADYFCGNVTNTPSGVAGSIEIFSSTAMDVTTPTGTNGFRVVPNQPLVLDAWIQIVIASSLYFVVNWYKFDGTASATANSSMISMTTVGSLWPSFSRIQPMVVVPSDAAYAAFYVSAQNGTKVRISELIFS